MKKFLPILILISALAVSGSAAFYSVFGLGKLFAGASLQVMIMAATLEFAKLVVATALHKYWKVMNVLMKTYLTIATIVLIGITSAGIYGFLSGAYQVTAAKDAIVTKQIQILELKKSRFDERRSELMVEKDQVIGSITDLRKSLSNPNQVQYIDRKSGQLVTTTSSSARNSLETQLQEAVSRRDKISDDIVEATDSLSYLDVAIVEAEANSDTSSELGPLKYLSGLTGKPMDIVVNWFLMLLIFVFDPLAVTLVILANFAFERGYGKDIVDSVSNSKNTNVIENSNINDITSDTQEVINVVGVENPDIIVSNDNPPTKRKVLSTDIHKDVFKRIIEALPLSKKKHDVVLQDTEDEVVLPKLNERQKANMTHQEIQDWYKKNMKQHG